MDFVHDIEKDDFLRAGGGYQPIQMASWPPVLPEPTSVRTLIERTRKMAETTRLGIFTERTKQRLWLLLIENPRDNLF